ncbi:hypothetical protein GXW82_17905 [Streptacidiphilus sp. 4-A2]|nr:hypothetical protein [Streptacidiphilus sp. 4-A2]
MKLTNPAYTSTNPCSCSCAGRCWRSRTRRARSEPAGAAGRQPHPGRGRAGVPQAAPGVRVRHPGGGRPARQGGAAAGRGGAHRARRLRAGALEAQPRLLRDLRHPGAQQVHHAGAAARLQGRPAGVGGVGSHVSLDVLGLGVRDLKVLDFDKVELSNLNRQILYSEADIGHRKVELAVRRSAATTPGHRHRSRAHPHLVRRGGGDQRPGLRLLRGRPAEDADRALGERRLRPGRGPSSAAGWRPSGRSST